MDEKTPRFVREEDLSEEMKSSGEWARLIEHSDQQLSDSAAIDRFIDDLNNCAKIYNFNENKSLNLLNSQVLMACIRLLYACRLDENGTPGINLLNALSLDLHEKERHGKSKPVRDNLMDGLLVAAIDALVNQLGYKVRLAADLVKKNIGDDQDRDLLELRRNIKRTKPELGMLEIGFFKYTARKLKNCTTEEEIMSIAQTIRSSFAKTV